ncbi:MAG: hypothetical protein ACI4IL_03940 [Eubacterium sp.]
MNVDEITSALRTISDFDDEEINRYLPIIDMNASLIDAAEVDEADHDAVIYYLSAKTYYEICLMQSGDEVTSFSAGDVKITQSSDVKRAKELFEISKQGAAAYIKDNAFAFLGV